MKRVIIFTFAVLLLASAGLYAAKAVVKKEKGAKTVSTEKIQIIKNGEIASAKGDKNYFTGTVRIDGLLPGAHPSNLSAGYVTFEPGARTAWHTHPIGQTLIVTYGVGRVQQEGGPIIEIRPGDVVWFPAGVKHWHGAAPDHALTHLAITGVHDEKAVDWMEHVSDTQYGA